MLKELQAAQLNEYGSELTILKPTHSSYTHGIFKKYPVDGWRKNSWKREPTIGYIHIRAFENR
jgi:hypothetical protein